MKFAHLADCHIGSWRDPLLSDLNLNAFEAAIDRIISEKVDFVSISGDLFNTSLPSIDKLKAVVKKLKDLKDAGISVYMIAGSHDFSPSGKTMLDVIENAGLVTNVAKAEAAEDSLTLKFTIDKKTDAKITGMIGKKGGLEKEYFQALNRAPLEDEPGFKIFMFHSLLSELKPSNLENVDSHPISLLPKKFDFYLGGHPHFVFSEHIQDYGMICYPGPIFPNSFKELEDLGHGGFFLIENSIARWIPIKLYDLEKIKIDCNEKSPSQIELELSDKLSQLEFKDKIVTLRLFGTLGSGKPSDLHLSSYIAAIKEKGAYTILKNTNALQSKDLEDVKIDLAHAEDIEDSLIEESIAGDELKLRDMDAKQLARMLLKSLDLEKQEGETVYNFEKRLAEEITKILGM